MKKNGYVVDESVDETSRLLEQWQYHVNDTSPRVFNVTLAPTMQCNYNCPYCFEAGKRNGVTMSQETADAVIAFIREKAENNPSLERISINGFGGEPLLNVDILEYICQAVQQLCKKCCIEFNGHITTNAFFLTPSVASRLSNCGITTAQVSIDGMPEVYAVSKGATSYAFYRVVDNIANACNAIRISVRINVHRDGLPAAVELTDYLLKERSLDGLIKIYIANIRQYGETVKAERANFLSWCKMNREYMQLFDPVSGKYMTKGLAIRSLKSHSVPCNNICKYNACIGPEGELYPCEHYFGDRRYISGSVFNGAMETEMSARLRVAQFPKGKECRKCTIAPICLGGCPDDNVRHHNIISCETYYRSLVDRKLLEIKMRSEFGRHDAEITQH